MRSFPIIFLFSLLCLFACEEKVDHSAPAVSDRDSASMMVSWGVNTLISDSGVMRYRMIAERWEVNTVKNPSFWKFDKGLVLEEFDEQFHVQAYITCDTAWYYDQLRIWELRGNVSIRTNDGTRFLSEELFWNQYEKKLYSYKYSKLTTADSHMEGTHFESDEPDNQGNLNHYIIDNTKGYFKASDMRDGKSGSNENSTPTSSVNPNDTAKTDTTNLHTITAERGDVKLVDEKKKK